MEKIKWTLGRIIDLEYCLRQEMAINDESYLKKRDEDIYIKHIRPTGSVSPPEILLIWLESIKNSEKRHCVLHNFSPGDLYEECLSILRIIFMIAGFVAGVSVCLTFFSYTGHQPLNVSYFLAITLFPQLFLLMMLFGFLLASKFNLIEQKRFAPYPFLGFIFEKSLRTLYRRSLKNISSEKRDTAEATLATINEAQKVYGPLFFWPMFILMQLFGIAFNIAILLSTIFRILFFDTAFGWQSTLQMSAQMVYKVVSVIASPWRWFLPAGEGFPDLDQIIGSRIVLKDGIYHLTTHDLVSWWPFMCLTLLFYGLLPRIIMFVSGLLSLKRSLEQQTFDHRECSRVLRRMVINQSSALSHNFDKQPVGKSALSHDADKQPINKSARPHDSDKQPISKNAA
ncbi:MAG: DUF2868 domain-containing protein, partial [Desulfamplus sp.]|nr:DUF2868 domain-containing protein [Desulfamplus sp.]